MIAENRNLLWAKVFVDELARAGLKAACLAPGSRSTPLTLAFAAHPDIAVYSHLDERSAGFFALGMALAAEAPVALVCTSGTAAANFYPAVIEANQAHAPLLLLTADRPHELRHSGANQTIDQVKLYGDHVRWFVDVAPPEANPAPGVVRYLRTLADRAVALAQGRPPGPVHLNFPLRKPLEPIPVTGDAPRPLTAAMRLALQGRPQQAPFTRISRGVHAPAAGQIDALVDAIENAARGLIVCGLRCPGRGFAQAVVRLARATQFPILADALSGVRFGLPEEDQDLILGGYETFLHNSPERPEEPPDLVLHFGAASISQALGSYLAVLPATSRKIAISESGVWADESHTIGDLVWADPALICRQVAERLPSRPGPAGWLAAFQQAEQRAWQRFEAARAETYFEGAILADVVDLLPPGALLYVASSLPVRHLDQFARPRSAPLRVFANRGASGIDGVISSALGAAAATQDEAPLALVTGDLAFYHDLTGLLALRRCGLRATIVLINNNGGGLFHRLPIAAFDPPFTDLFLTPHGLDFGPAAAIFGARHVRVQEQEALRRALQAAIGAETPHIVEVVTDSALHEKMRQKIITATIG